MFNPDGADNFTTEIKRFVPKFEREYIKSRLQYVNDHYCEENLAIGLIHETSSTGGVSWHLMNYLVIEKYGSSGETKNVLAVALAMFREGAYYRKSAIMYFEKYFNNPLPTKAIRDLYKYWFPEADSYERYIRCFKNDLHLFLAELYEKECQFDSAIEQLQLGILDSRRVNPKNFVKIGDILIKVDIQKAKEYYDLLSKTDYYRKYSYAFGYAYEKLCEKLSSGYVYKPRIIRKPLELNIEQSIAKSIVHFFL